MQILILKIKYTEIEGWECCENTSKRHPWILHVTFQAEFAMKLEMCHMCTSLFNKVYDWIGMSARTILTTVKQPFMLAV